MQASTSSKPQALGEAEKVLLKRLVEEAHELRRPHPEMHTTYEIIEPNFNLEKNPQHNLDYNAFRSIHGAPMVGNYCFKRHREELAKSAQESFDDYPYCLIPKKKML